MLFNKLPEDMRFRHVRFWLSNDYCVDHTWEREWRLKTDSLPLDPKEVTVVVPDRSAKEALVEDTKDTNWHYLVLSDLGVKVEPL